MMRSYLGIYFVTADFVVSEALSIEVPRTAQTCKIRQHRKMFDRRLQIGMVAVKKNLGLFVRKLAASLVMCVVCIAGAKAADLPMQAYKAAPVAVQVYNWTGFYVGVNGGYGWGTQDPLTLFSDRFDRSSFSNSGGMFGGTIGAQIQQGYIVLGVEGDLDWANIKGSTISTPTIGGLVLPGLPITLNIATNTSAVGTARLRAGVAMNNWLFYATGGVAFVKESANGTSIAGVPCGTLGAFPSCSASAWRPGIAAGLGAEWGFAQNWSAKLEYLYIDAVGSGVSTNHIDSVRSGINYRF